MITRRVMITLGVTILAGCSHLPITNTCGPVPKPLSNKLDGEDYITRAQAWESYGMCLESLMEPAPAMPTLEPDMREGFDEAREQILNRRQWALPSRRVLEAKSEGPKPPTGSGPLWPIATCIPRLGQLKKTRC